MPPSKRTILQTALETETPPSSLTPTQSIAQIIKSPGNNLYLVRPPQNHHHQQHPQQQEPPTEFLVELPPKFRSKIWLRRGGYIVIDTEDHGGDKHTIIAKRDHHYLQQDHEQQVEDRSTRKAAGGKGKEKNQSRKLKHEYGSAIQNKKKTNIIVINDTHKTKRKETKIHGEIINIVRSEKEWRKMSYWPTEFTEQPHNNLNEGDLEEGESTVGRLPPSYSDEERED